MTKVTNLADARNQMKVVEARRKYIEKRQQEIKEQQVALGKEHNQLYLEEIALREVERTIRALQKLADTGKAI